MANQAAMHSEQSVRAGKSSTLFFYFKKMED
jgi:hypothetical protein